MSAGLYVNSELLVIKLHSTLRIHWRICSEVNMLLGH
jgi:hypothetical protein